MPGWSGEFEPELSSLYSGINVFYPLIKGCLKFTLQSNGSEVRVYKKTTARPDPIVLSNLNELIRNLNKPIRNLNEPIRNLNEPIRNLSEPIRNLNEPIFKSSNSRRFARGGRRC